MTHSLFISYSRREAPFVDVLLDALEDKGVQVWLDYRSLTPGKPWLEQILAGIESAEVFLLIISKASMASKNVELEYQYALKQKKRIVLLIFEAVPLPMPFKDMSGSIFGGASTINSEKYYRGLSNPSNRVCRRRGDSEPQKLSGWLSSSVYLQSLFPSPAGGRCSCPYY